MKTISKATFVFAFVAFANSIFAAGNLKVNILPLSAERAVFSIATLPNSNLEITVMDDNDQIIYSRENSKSDENERIEFDFSDLKVGKYKLIVVCNDLITERLFRKTQQGIKVGREKTILKPFFWYDDGMLRYTYLNFSKENVTLYFLKKNQLLYTKEIGKNFNINEAINLSKLGSGNYRAILSAGDREYSYTVEKQ